MVSLKTVKDFIKREDIQFMMRTGVKFSLIQICVAFLVAYLFWLLININYIFFKANGFPEISTLKEAFYDHVLGNIVDKYMSIVVIGVIFLFLIGNYIGFLLLRPFKVIGEYCEVARDQKNLTFAPNQFSELKLLNRSSEYFFQYICDCRLRGDFNPTTLPQYFSGVHKPVFDRVFFFHFFIFICLICIFSSALIVVLSVEIHSSIVELALEQLKGSSQFSTKKFLLDQQFLISSVKNLTIITILVSYTSLAFHLYAKVSGAAYGFFSTIRSFLKGNKKARVHLVGFNHVRQYSRSFNKYLDYIVKEIEQEDHLEN